jgi:hypothetical protein
MNPEPYLKIKLSTEKILSAFELQNFIDGTVASEKTTQVHGYEISQTLKRYCCHIL